MPESRDDSAQFWARRPMGYAGIDLDRGQIFRTVGAPNDSRLLRLGYMVPLDAKADAYACAVCGAEFVGEGERLAHGDKHHRPTPADPREEDRRIEREERHLEQVAPLYLDRTAAALR